MLFRTIFIVALFTFISQANFAQNAESSGMEVYQYQLKNGLTVYLNVDHNQPFVFGAVVVKGGSKQDPPDATGAAHYMEHLMFRGTDSIGTINYKLEKPLLDSISYLYDQLPVTQAEADRQKILRDITRLSVIASRYIIPDDLDNLLKEIGSSNINAYTSDDCIVYHNVFPGNQLEKWVEIYSHRFINPVFRAFQAELEVVYEEKNMYEDDFFYKLYEDFYKELYSAHPYGQQPALGTTEHLKNPSISKIYNYYRQTYVGKNMALVLSGNFDRSEAVRYVEKWFNRIPYGDTAGIAALPTEIPLTSKKVVRKRIIPYRYGIMAWRSPALGEKDALLADLCAQILSNSSRTGLLDQLVNEGKIHSIEAYTEPLVDYGSFQVSFLPKTLTKGFSGTEKQVIRTIEKLSKGDYPDFLLDGAKASLLKKHYKYFESVQQYDYEEEDYIGRPDLIINSFIADQPWTDVLNTENRLQDISKDDIMTFATKTFANNYLYYQCRIGRNKPATIEKPEIEPLQYASESQKSAYSRHLEDRKEKKVKPEFIEIGKDVTILDERNGHKLFHSNNPYNQMFNMSLRIGIGSYEIPQLITLAKCLNVCGTVKRTKEELTQQLSKIGTSITFECTQDYFTIEMDGFDENLTESILIAKELLNSPLISKENLDMVRSDMILDNELEFVSPDIIADALFEYCLYHDKSSYINRPSAKELKKITPEEISGLSDTILQYESFVHYSGSLDPSEVYTFTEKYLAPPLTFIKSDSPVEPLRYSEEEPSIYFVNMKNCLQSYIYLFVEGSETKSSNDPYIFADLFNQYFDDIVYNEIRDFRSLAYEATAEYIPPYRKTDNGFTFAYLSTQADKTIEATEALINIFANMPEYEEMEASIRNSAIQKISSEKPSFRSRPYWAEYISGMGYKEDPAILKNAAASNFRFQQLSDFYKEQIKGKPYTIMIVGDMHRFDTNLLYDYAEEITFVNPNDLFRE